MPVLPVDQWPAVLRPFEGRIKGLFVGGCVRRGDGSRFRAKAHAHFSSDAPYGGWICVLSAKRLDDRLLMLHEAAHVLADAGHVDKWRRVLLEIGGSLDPVPGVSKSYHKKRRGPKGKGTPFKVIEGGIEHED